MKGWRATPSATILSNLSCINKKLALACLVDFSKAFNRQDYNILVLGYGCSWQLLKLVIAFLKDRKMKVNSCGKYSNLFSLPGGGPQGSLLGLFLFLVLINDSGYVGQLNKSGDLITHKKRMMEMNVIHLKYVDNLELKKPSTWIHS